MYNNPKRGAFIKEDRDKIARVLVKHGAARNLPEGKDQFDKLYTLQERGIIGRINTEAMSSNADLTTDFWVQKMNLDSVENIMRKGLDPIQINKFKKFATTSKKILDAVYSTTEITNRIAAALATYNTVIAEGEKTGSKNNKIIIAKGLEPIKNFAVGTASEITDQGDILIETIEDAMQFVVDESQFNLSAFNRPRIAFAGKGLGAITLQFIPFVNMMLEVYANAITRYGGSEFGIGEGKTLRLTPQGKRTLAFLVLPQIILGGVFGLPFADDIKEIIKTIVRSPIGKSLDLQSSDIEVAFYDIMVDIFGKDSLSLAEAIARGPIKAWGGVDIAQRVSLSPLRGIIQTVTGQQGAVSFLAGPSGSYFENSIAKSWDAFERGDIGKAILRFIPVALAQNLINSWEAGEAGVFTGGGRPLGDGLGAKDLFLMSMGFSTENVYQPRDLLYRKKDLVTKSNAIKDKYVDKIIRLKMMQRISTDPEEKEELQREIQKIYKYVRDHDRGKKIHNKIDPNYNMVKTVVTRFQDQVLPSRKYRGGLESISVDRLMRIEE